MTKNINFKAKMNGILIKRIRIRKWGIKVIAFLLCFLLVVEGFTIPVTSVQDQIKQVKKSFQDFTRVLTGIDDSNKPSKDQIVKRVKKSFEDIEKVKQEIPRDTFDLGAVIIKVGKDPIKLFKWVRDKTFLVPYRGVLRGHQGVLMDRLGNSFDRALLLYAMLRESGKEVRLAHGSLSFTQGLDVLKKARPIPEGGALQIEEPPSEEIDKLIEKYVQQYPMNQGEIQKHVRKLELNQKHLNEAVIKRVEEQALFISEAVGKPKKGAKKAAQIAALEAVLDHWWVQWYNDSKWTDLDPTLPDAEPGQSLVKASETIQPKNYGELKNFCHSIQIRVIVEFWKKGQLQEAEVMNQFMLPMVMFGKRLVLRHAPPAWPQDMNIFQSDDPIKQLKDTVLKQREWLPFLMVDSNYIYKYSFLIDSTNIFNAKLPTWAAAAQKGREVVAGVEKGALGLGRGVKGLLSRTRRVDAKKTKKDEKPLETHLTAEWIEYEIKVPGQKSQKIRREIFDLLGPAVRASGKKNMPMPKITEEKRLERGFALLGETEILPLACQLSSNFVDDLILNNLLNNSKVLLNLFSNKEKTNQKTLISQIKDFKFFPDQLYTLALTRQNWSRFHKDIYLDRPNIFTHHKWLRQDSQGKIISSRSVDIVANHMAVNFKSDEDPFFIRLEQGVLDTNAETVLAMIHNPFTDDTSGCCEKIENTADLFAASKEYGIEWFTIRSVNNNVLEKLEISSDARSRIKADLSSGYIIIMPRRAILEKKQTFIGWWRVEPNSGQTLGIGKRGWGQTTTEYFMQSLIGAEIIYYSCVKGHYLGGAAVKHSGSKEEYKAHLECACWAIILAIGYFVLRYSLIAAKVLAGKAKLYGFLFGASLKTACMIITKGFL